MERGQGKNGQGTNRLATGLHAPRLVVACQDGQGMQVRKYQYRIFNPLPTTPKFLLPPCSHVALPQATPLAQNPFFFLCHPACLVPPHVPPSVNRTPHPPTITHGKLDRDFQARTQGVGARSEPTRSAPAGWSSGGHKQPTKRNRTQPTGLDVKKQAAREPSKGSKHHQQGGDRMRQQKLSTAATAPHVTSPGLAKMAASVCCPSPTKTQPRAHTTHTHTRQKRAAAGAGPRPRANQNSQWKT